MSKLLTSLELADHLNVTPRWVRRQVDQRRIPFLKVGALVRFDLDEIEAWMDANRVEVAR